MRLTVAALAKRVDVAPDTIRYYEKTELLPAPQRTAAGYRVYDETAVDRLRFIRGAQRLGLRLSDVKALLAVRDTGECPCEPAEHLLRNRIAEVDQEITRLRGLRRDLIAMADELPSEKCPDPTPGTWRSPSELNIRTQEGR